MKDRDTVDDEGEDLSNGLGGDVRHGLVVRCRYGRENSVQEGSYRTIEKAATPLLSFSSPVSL
jgi:hypothetical protein